MKDRHPILNKTDTGVPIQNVLRRMTLISSLSRDGAICAIEPFIEGTYRKHNNNYGSGTSFIIIRTPLRVDRVGVVFYDLNSFRRTVLFVSGGMQRMTPLTITLFFSFFFLRQ